MSRLYDDNFDPYAQLIEITEFCKQADNHIANMLQNQKTIVTEFNKLREDIDLINARIELLEQILEQE